jgi:hypothetical protein
MRVPLTSLRRIALIQLIVCIIGFAIFYVFDRKDIIPFADGAGLITINFALLTWFWKRIFEKKPVALTFGLVVFKYAILAMVLYIFVRESNLPLTPLLGGLATLAISLLMSGLLPQTTKV